MMDDSGMLSVDFLAGFTIFILALIMVINMVPGIMIGLESQNIDYDAVAYRTGVILVEDPGWPANPPWELKDEYHKDDIHRLGLAVSANTPNVLSRSKINKFFNTSFFTDEDYGQKVIFADMPYAPYAYNIALKVGDESLPPLGDDVPKRSYGYIRRLVKVKEPHSAELDLNKTEHKSKFEKIAPVNSSITNTYISIVLNYTELYDKSISDEYRMDVRMEPVEVTIRNFKENLNDTDVEEVCLNNIRFYKEGVSGEIPFGYDEPDDESYEYKVGGTSRTLDYNSSLIWDLNGEDEIYLKLNPPLPFAYETDTVLMVNMSLKYYYDENRFNLTKEYLGGVIDYTYDTSANSPMNLPTLTDGVLEVCVW
ncbi:MAG: hypothetical protein QCH35_04425 [Methanomicrobiaceae archaeon]|nr:hypothetical protein [Methanomicrobiaceae archaeon]